MWRTLALAVLGAVVVIVALLFIRLRSPRGIELTSAFPDELLRNQVAAAADLDGDGMLSASELAELRSLRVVGVKRVEGLEVLEYLEELIVEGEGVEYVEVRDLPHLERITAVDTPDLGTVDIVNCPNNKHDDFSGAENLGNVTYGDPNDDVDIIVPPGTIVTGSVPAPRSRASVVSDCLYTEYNYRSDGGTGTLNHHWSAAYDDEGKIVSLAYENWMDAPADLPANYQADWTYDDDGQLASIAVASEAPLLQGTWEVTADASGERSLLFAPDDPSAVREDVAYGPSPAPLFRVDAVDERGLVTESTYRAVSARSQGITKGAVEATYDADGKPVLVKNGSFNGPAQSLDHLYAAEWTYEMTYDQSGRMTGLVVSFPEYVESYDYAYDSAGQLLSVNNGIDGRTYRLVTYSYDQQGHLASAEASASSGAGESITFATDEYGRVTDATIQRENGTSAEYHVEYATVYVRRGALPLSPLGVCLADPSNPIVENVPWAMEYIPFTQKDFFRMNEAWLAAQGAEADAEDEGSQDDGLDQDASYTAEEAAGIYQPVIDDYRANGTVYPELPDRAYAIDDLDGNGVPELLLGSPTGAILQLWTIDAGGSPVMLVEGVPRGAYTALVDGRLFCRGSSGAMDGTDTVHRIEGTQLVEVMRFEYHGDDCTYTNSDEGIAGEPSSWDFWSGISGQLVERDDLAWQAL